LLYICRDNKKVKITKGVPARGEDFFNREDVLRDIWKVLDQSSILLVGPRRFGKISVMRRLENNPKSEFTPIIILDEVLKINSKNKPVRCIKDIIIKCCDKYKKTMPDEEMHKLFLEYFLILLKIDVEHCEDRFNPFKYRFGKKFTGTFSVLDKTIAYFKYKKDKDKDEELVLEKLFPEEREIVNQLIERVEK